MRKNFFKATLAVVCVVAAGTGSWKAYSAYNGGQSEMNVLLSENIEALSYPDTGKEPVTCYKTITESKDKGCYYCPGCQWMDDSDSAFLSGTDKCNP